MRYNEHQKNQRASLAIGGNMKANFCRNLFLSVLFLCLFGGGTTLPAVEINFDEEFSLATDRSIPLQQLIPGTEDYYYYYCLYHQQRGETEEVNRLLKQWIKRFSHTARVEEIRTRQVLFEYTRNPERVVQFIIERLNLQFNHSKKQTAGKMTYPSTLPASWLDFTGLKAFALRDYSDLSGFKYPGLEVLQKEKLDNDRRRDLLNRLKYPDGDDIARMVVEDLQHQYSGGFGSLAIHGRLLSEQLEYCMKAMPELLNQSPFIMAYLQRMQPGADAEWESNIPLKLETLNRMYGFAAGLAPAFNSLKAHLLYHILDLKRSLGEYDRALFIEYLKLPRNVSYLNSRYFETDESRLYRADLSADFKAATMREPIGSDEPLVRDYLQRLMLVDKDSAAFAGYIESEYLKRLLAETMIVNAVGDMEKWFSLIDGYLVKELKERVELELLPANRQVYRKDELVSLAVRIKNVKKLFIKIYQINLPNFYRTNLSEISTAIDLDGLVANEEMTIEYAQPSYQRHDEIFELKTINKNGVFIVELIGNGMSSRAMIRRGQLSYLQRPGSAGHVFTVFDEGREKVKDASILLAGTEYKADAGGSITVPYTTSPARRQFVLKQGDFAALHTFDHLGESYTLEAALHADREALIEGKTATLLVKPSLMVNGCPVDVKLLKETSLLITSVDREGIEATREVKDFQLFNDKEATFEFKVPEKLNQLRFTLRGKIENLSQGKKDELSVSRTFAINGIDKTEKTHAFFVRKNEGEYIVELLGKSGEPCPDRVVNLELSHRMVVRTIQGSLQTDDQGRMHLGRLEDIESVRLSGPEDVSLTFIPVKDQNNLPDVVCSAAGMTVRIPMTGSVDRNVADLCCLYEVRSGNPVIDYRKNVTLEKGFYVIKGLPAGDYELYLKQLQRNIQLKIADGRSVDGYVVSQRRGLPAYNSQALQVTDVTVTADNSAMVIKLANHGQRTRVHVLAGRFLPEFKPFNEFAALEGPSYPEIYLTAPVSRYLSGRNIGDEYRYILERRYAKIFPGNMLKRPGLLLNPWSLRKTDTGTRDASEGGAWGGAPESAPQSSAAEKKLKRQSQQQAATDGFARYDFLSEPSLLFANLRPDSEGNVLVDLKGLKSLHNLQIVAVDGFDVACGDVSLPEVAATHRDLRLSQALAPDGHFSQQKNISVLASGASLIIEDISTARVEVYDSLATAYRLLTTIRPDANMTGFAFITGWNALDEAKKLELYSKNSCHELNFFIYNRDRDFFEKVVKPYIANKRDKTFMDRWLLDLDLSGYTEPWAFSRLNVVEKILLGQKMPAMKATIRRHVQECFELLPDDREKFNLLFRTALQGSALETGDRLGLEAGRKDLNEGIDKGDFSGLAADMAVPEPAPMMEAEGRFAMAPVRPAAKPMAPPPPAVSKQRAAKKEMASEESMAMDDFDEAAEYEEDSERRDNVRQVFRQVDKTEEWVENNYYQLPIELQVADLVKVNAFWRDYAEHEAGRPFISKHLAEAAGNFTEMMLALAVLELPFTAGKHGSEFKGPQMIFKAAGNAVVFHEEIKPAIETSETAGILTGQNFFALNDRYRYDKNERFDKFVTEEFLTRVVYGCQVVLTNPTSSRKKVDVLMQIPKGAIPVLQSLTTRSLHMQLEGYSTQTSEYYFYFPAPGSWTHFPVHVSENEKMLATTRPFVFKVVNELTSFDRTSWPWLSQNGSDAEVLEFLAGNNIERLDLAEIAFRMKDRDFFLKAYELLKSRHAFNQIIWSYGLKHNHLPAMREYLAHSPLVDQIGSNIETELLSVDPVERHTYQHREYWPLVNARVYPLGKKREILNEQLAAQYHALLADLRYRSPLSDHDLLAVVYYLLLQDRITDASAFFARIKDAELAKTIQYQYMKAYLAFSNQQVEEALNIARQFKDYPVQRWNALFADVVSQAGEITGGAVTAGDSEDRDQKQRLLAASQPDLELSVDNRVVTLRHRNLKGARISYYQMDIELMFSRNPFVQEVTGQFAIIRPNMSVDLDLTDKPAELKIDLPERYRDSNLMIEVSGGGLTRNMAYYPHSLAISMIEAYGQLQVRNQKTGQPLASAYVKVYARQKDGQVVFYKDGYTDLRGRFDYASISTSQLENVEKFSVLIMSDIAGSVIREAAPPNN